MSGSCGFDLIRAAYAAAGLDEHERAVLVLLAFMANDERQAWPSIAYIVEKTGKGERTVQRAIKRLVEGGHLSRRQRRHDTAVYVVHPQAGVEGGDDPKPVSGTGVGGTGVSGTPVSEGVKTRPTDTLIAKNNQTSPDASHPARSRKAPADQRAKRLPEDWEPEPFPDGSAAADVTAGWPPGRLDRELSKFRDHFRAQPGVKGRKTDWQATYRNWVIRADEQQQRNRSPRGHWSERSRYRDPLLDRYAGGGDPGLG